MRASPENTCSGENLSARAHNSGTAAKLHGEGGGGRFQEPESDACIT